MGAESGSDGVRSEGGEDAGVSSAECRGGVAGKVGVGVTGGSPGSWLDRASEFVDAHLRVFRAVPWCLGGLGAVLMLRYSPLFVRHRSSASLPQQLLAANVRLSGVVAAARTDSHSGSVDVWHVPPARRLLRWGHRPPKCCPSNEFLCVEFAGVAMAIPEQAQAWLEGEVVGRRVRCVLLSRSEDGRSLRAIVHARRKGLFHGYLCVNEKLVSLGLAAIADAPGFHSNRAYADFMTALGRREQKAQSRGEGVWEGTEWERWVWRGRRRLVGWWRGRGRGDGGG